jgi:hypothetical protein
MRINTKLISVIGGKALVVPAEGWNAGNFARHGSAMILALARVAKITQRRKIPILANKMNALGRRQIRGVISRVMEWTAQGRKAKAPAITFDIPAGAELWAEAMNEVFQESGLEAVATVMPEVQSVMAQGYEKTSILLGQQPDDINRLVTIYSRTIARRITNISETTRKRIMEVVNDSIASGLDVVETAGAIESAAPQIYGNRSLTIARTELNGAWNKSAVIAMQESNTITHVSVIGCEAREPGSPKYRGESTCNIMDVPIIDADKLEFHINHTGNIIPSGFRNADGTDENNQPRPAILDQAEEISDRQAEEAGDAT